MASASTNLGRSLSRDRAEESLASIFMASLRTDGGTISRANSALTDFKMETIMLAEFALPH
jgi:hypothetical protein